MKTFSRRDFVKNTALVAAALRLPDALAAQTPAAPAAGVESKSPAAPRGAVALKWLDGRAPAATAGVTWGVPWPRGAHAKDTPLAVRTAAGQPVAVQTWPLAYWPDGSLKWTAHALPGDAPASEHFFIAPGAPAASTKAVNVRETADEIEVDTGVIRARLAKKGSALFTSLARDGKEIARAGRLVALREDRTEEGSGVTRTESFTSEISAVMIEQRGPVRAVVKIEGRHAGAGTRAWLPFVVRLYFHAGAESLRLMHSFVFDGDENTDFIRGLGVRFNVAMSDPLHDRHVRFAGEGTGLWGEAVRTLTGLRRDPDERGSNKIKDAQIAGRATPSVSTFAGTVRGRLQYIPAWGDFSLFQSAANAFTLRKRTQAGHGWIDVDQGGRAAGLGYIGGANGGGVAFGLRDFWQRHPTQLDVRGAATDAAEVTLWLWSPDAPAMDLRFYHDGLGMDTYEKQYDGGLAITYEDYEKGWGSAHGVARSSELMLWVLPATPSRERLVELADAVRTPALLTCMPAHFVSTGIFGGLFSLPDRSTPVKAAIEDRLDWFFDFYRKETDRRHWYGFWNYGDVMHSYDADRHVWRYDVGGFAWANSELSPDLWLWYAYLRSGRADIFRFAEAMTRHTGEVDVHHLGRFAGLGSRHNVQHWGCSAKQVRISTVVYRRFYYFLTADERVGDLMREVLDADAKFDLVDPVRKLKDPPPRGEHPARISVGTDWCSLAAAWLTEWERGGDPKYRDKLLTGMKDIGAAKHGFFSGDRFGYDPANGHLYNILGDKVAASHLSAVFGALEVCAELIQLVDDPAFEQAWLQYCELYNSSREDQARALGGQSPSSGGLRNGHSRLTAYAAWRRKDPQLAARAWAEFSRTDERAAPPPLKTTHIAGPAVLNPVDEAAWVSTNSASQWGLAAIQNLALIRESLP